MKVYEVTARYQRRIAPRDYEHAEGELVFKSTVDDGENFAEVSALLLGKAKQQVQYALGFIQPATEEAEVVAATQPGEQTAVDPSGEVLPTPTTGKGGRKKATPKRRGKAAEPVAIPGVDMGKIGAAAASVPQPAQPVDFDGDILDANLQAAASKAAKAHGSKVVKELMSKTYKVAKLGDMTQEQRKAFLAELAALGNG